MGTWLVLFQALLLLAALSPVHPAPPRPAPTSQPTRQPSRMPTSQPSRQPSSQPSSQPSRLPTSQPSRQPSSQPTSAPTKEFPHLIEWIPDYINITHGPVIMTSHWHWNISIASNGQIFHNRKSSELGHFRVVLDVKSFGIDDVQVNYTGISNCINVGAGDTLRRQLMQIRMIPEGLSSDDYIHGEVSSNDMFSINLKQSTLSGLHIDMRDQLDHHVINSTTLKRIQYDINFRPKDSRFGIFSVDASISREGCWEPQTVSNWDDPRRWFGGRVPGPLDSVRIPKGSGVVVLRKDVVVKDLIVEGGVILASDSSCPLGWISGPFSPQYSDGTSYSSQKCYKLFENASTYEDADAACRYSGESSMDSRLVHINDYEELDVAKRICQGSNVDSSARNHGCWIGLKYNPKNSQFAWLDNDAVTKTSFRNWRRFMGEDNRTVSEGVSTPGELCVSLVPWQEDPLHNEQGSMNDIACALNKPYICQLKGVIKKFSITVTWSTYLNGGALRGGDLKVEKWSKIDEFDCTDACTITVVQGSKLTLIKSLYLRRGSALIANSPIAFRSDSIIGEALDAKSAVQPLVLLNAPLITQTTCASCDPVFTVIINAQVISTNKIQIEENVVVLLKQGGDLSSATIETAANASLVLGGYSTKLSSYDAFDLTLSHRGPVLGEYNNDIPKDLARGRIGVFRLAVEDSYISNGIRRTRKNITKCIPYNASASELKSYLSSFPGIIARGGVTVRRYGEGKNSDFYYGYSHRIEIDAPYTRNYDWGSLSITFQCYGIAGCGCAETVVPLKDLDGIVACPKTGNSSRVDPNSCVIPPKISLNRVSSQSYTQTSGLGSVVIGNGVHRLPPKVNMTVSAVGGRGIVSADTITWYKAEAIAMGTLVITGSGWDSWDSANVIFKDSWEFRRGFVSILETVNTFVMDLELFHLNGLGAIYTAAPNAVLNWKSGVWDGGSIGGRSTVYVSDAVNASGTNKALRYECTLWFLPGSQLFWNSGNVSLADGADMIMEGTLYLNTLTKYYMGQASLLEVPSSDIIGAELLSREPGRNWHGYFDLTLPSELWGGWYQNPLCGSQCLEINDITVQKNGTVICATNAQAGFRSPLNLIGYARLTILINGTLEIFTGGICGNKVIMDMFQGSAIELSSGSFLMQETCTVRGEGELLVTDGDHNLAFSIDAHITIAGGKMVWPLSRGTGKQLTFNGGLLLENIGVLEVQPFSTKILITKEVVMKESCLIQFPMIGIGAQASPSDRQDAPDSSPRGILTAVGTFTWLGGTLRGKADFNANSVLYLDGDTKYIRSLAKLVNHGHCEWGTGDLITDDNGGLLNLGTTQIMNEEFSASNMFKGTVVPVENGGDVFALSFHSYDMDEGRLTYEEYVTLRTQFVSRAPPGWSEKSQARGEVPIAL